MKIPDKVKVGDREYVVKFSPRPCKNDTCVDGEIIYSDGTIFIKSDESFAADYTECVLIHEIIHAIYHHFGIEQREDDVTKIARGVHMVMKDNPELFH